MTLLINYIGEAIGIVAGLLSIIQVVIGRDKSRLIRVLEERNSELTRELATGSSVGTTSATEPSEALNYDRPRLEFKHAAHRFDRLRKQALWGVIAFLAISCLIVSSVVDSSYFLISSGHFFALPILWSIVYITVRIVVLRKLHSLFEDASYRGDKDLTELQNWINTQHWKRQSTPVVLNKAVMKWQASVGTINRDNTEFAKG